MIFPQTERPTDRNIDPQTLLSIEALGRSWNIRILYLIQLISWRQERELKICFWSKISEAWLMDIDILRWIKRKIIKKDKYCISSMKVWVCVIYLWNILHSIQKIVTDQLKKLGTEAPSPELKSSLFKKKELKKQI